MDDLNKTCDDSSSDNIDETNEDEIYSFSSSNSNESSCCSSCCEEDTEDPSQEVRNFSDALQLKTLTDRKNQVLSNLSILPINKESASIEQVLQFVEALTYSKGYLRRPNLELDICLECLAIDDLPCTCIDVTDNEHVPDKLENGSTDVKQSTDNQSAGFLRATTFQFPSGLPFVGNNRRNRQTEHRNSSGIDERAASTELEASDSIAAKAHAQGHRISRITVDDNFFCQRNETYNNESELQNGVASRSSNNEDFCEDCARESIVRRFHQYKSELKGCTCEKEIYSDSFSDTSRSSGCSRDSFSYNNNSCDCQECQDDFSDDSCDGCDCPKSKQI